MKTTEEMIEIMKAYEEGKKIECLDLNAKDLGWYLIVKSSWNWVNCDYRVKPEHKTRPMTFEEIVTYWKEHRVEIVTILYSGCKPTECFISHIDYEENTINLSDGSCMYIKEFVERVRKEDGSKFEVIEHEG